MFRHNLQFVKFFFTTGTIILLDNVSCELNIRPQDAVRQIGESVEFPCGTTFHTEIPVYWEFHPKGKPLYIGSFNGTATGVRLFDAGYLVDAHKERFAVNESVKGLYTLEIKNIALSDDGNYVCVEDSGHGPDYVVVNLRVEKPYIDTTTYNETTDGIINFSNSHYDTSEKSTELIAGLTVSLCILTGIIICIIVLVQRKGDTCIRKKKREQIPNGIQSDQVDTIIPFLPIPENELKRVLNSNKINLQDNMLPEEVGIKLREKQCLTEQDQERILDQNILRKDKVKYIFDRVISDTQRLFNPLVEALKETDQNHLAQLLIVDEKSLQYQETTYRGILEDNADILVHFMQPDSVLIKLFARDIITREDVSTCRMQNRERMVECILEILLNRSVLPFKELIEALENTNQTHLSQRLNSSISRKVLMTESHKRVINQNRSIFENLQATDVHDVLEKFGWPEHLVKKVEISNNATDCLLEILLCRPDHDFVLFLRALDNAKENQRQLLLKLSIDEKALMTKEHEMILNSNRYLFVTHMNLGPHFFAELQQNSILSVSDVTNIERNNRFMQIDCLIDHILCKYDSAFSGLVDALNNTAQGKLAELLRTTTPQLKTGLRTAMSSDQKGVLLQRREILEDNMQPWPVVVKLQSQQCLASRNAADIKATSSRVKMAKSLLDTLLDDKHVPSVTLTELIEALNETKQTHLSRLLTNPMIPIDDTILMTNKHRNVLDRKETQEQLLLLTMNEISRITKYLFDTGCLSSWDRQEIIEETTDQEKVKRQIENIKHRPDYVFKYLVDVLNKLKEEGHTCCAACVDLLCRTT